LQKYGLFHKFHDTNELYKLISGFQSDKGISSINIYGPDIKFIWKIFRIYFTEVEAAVVLLNMLQENIFLLKRTESGSAERHIEHGESPEECAVREVHEECGISNHKITNRYSQLSHIYVEGISYLKKTHWF